MSGQLLTDRNRVTDDLAKNLTTKFAPIARSSHASCDKSRSACPCAPTACRAAHCDGRSRTNAHCSAAVVFRGRLPTPTILQSVSNPNRKILREVSGSSMTLEQTRVPRSSFRNLTSVSSATRSVLEARPRMIGRVAGQCRLILVDGRHIRLVESRHAHNITDRTAGGTYRDAYRKGRRYRFLVVAGLV